MAKTYGQASAATLKERQSNDDPLKWRKHVSYAEFTPPHTPVEGHHIPGYSGHVPGVYAENLYSKTYGKTTLKAVTGEYAKGCVQQADEQYKTNNQVHFAEDIPHPGRPTDIAPGGASWSGASPYNVEEPPPLEPTNPWPPSVVQIAGGKEPTQTSIILKNFPPTVRVPRASERSQGAATRAPPRAAPTDFASLFFLVVRSVGAPCVLHMMLRGGAAVAAAVAAAAADVAAAVHAAAVAAPAAAMRSLRRAGRDARARLADHAQGQPA